MSAQNISTSTLRSSFLLTLATAALVVLTISCSDLNDEDGITNTEFQQAQSQMDNQSQGNQPLYIINGERTESPDKVSLIKSKYIKSINVLKDQKAVDNYGQDAENGAVEIQFIDDITKEEVFSDLKDEADPAIDPKTESGEDYFVAVEDMPELKGGLAELQKEITYPEEAREAGDEGRVIVQFIVNEQGEVEEPQIMRGVSESLDEEALRVVREAEFIPGRQRGQPVRVQYSLPIIFKLSSSTKQEPTADIETPKVEGTDMKFEDFQVSDDGTISAKVFSTREDEALAGANIVVEGTQKGTSTDKNGDFSLQNLEKGTHNLVISYVGYETVMTEVEIK